MSIPRPRYLPASMFEGPALKYTWDDWDVAAFYTDVDKELVQQWADLFEPAVCGLTIAISEWVLFRQFALENDPLIIKFLEAAWCANIDRRYSEGLEVSRNDWLGPIRGPVRVAMKLLHSTLYESQEGPDKPVEGPALMSRLVEHVCGVKEEFRQWRAQCVDRLRKYYVAPPALDDMFDEQTSKVMVPREAFDPEFPFDPEDARILVDQFLRKIDFASNLFLLSPQAMVEAEFEGTPYSVS
jgi:hypothetical protein